MPPGSKSKTRQSKRRPAAKRGQGASRSSPAPDERKKQILKAAVEVFAERGYHGCRISDVADRAGVAYGLVYHYFGNKEALLDHIFQANWEVFGKALEDVAAQEGLTPRQDQQGLGVDLADAVDDGEALLRG